MIRNTIIEIVLVVLMVFASIPIWKSFDLEKYVTIAEQGFIESNTVLEVSDYKSDMLYQTSDDNALENIEPINIKLSNQEETEETFTLYFVISKNSTLDYNALKVNYLNKTAKLNELEMLEDEEYYYFELITGEIINDEINFGLILWIDIENDYEIANKGLSFDIINITGQEILV